MWHYTVDVVMGCQRQTHFVCESGTTKELWEELARKITGDVVLARKISGDVEMVKLTTLSTSLSDGKVDAELNDKPISQREFYSYSCSGVPEYILSFRDLAKTGSAIFTLYLRAKDSANAAASVVAM